MSEQNSKADALFEALSKDKKRRKRKLIRTVLIIVAVIAMALVVTVTILRKNVEKRFAAAAAEVQSYQVTTGTIHTTVSGTGVLTEDDLEEITVPAGVAINEVMVDAGETVQKGDLLATVDMATVMTALMQADEAKKAAQSADNLRKQLKTFFDDNNRTRVEMDNLRRENAQLRREKEELERKLAAQ